MKYCNFRFASRTSTPSPAFEASRCSPQLAVAVAAALFFTGCNKKTPSPDTSPASAELELYVSRGQKPFLWKSEPLQPGDRLRYSFRAPQPLHVMVLSRDGQGAVQRYFPETSASWPLQRGFTLAKTTTELDATLGEQSMWGIFCQSPFTDAALLAELGREAELAAPVGCSVVRLTIHKQAATPTVVDTQR